MDKIVFLAVTLIVNFQGLPQNKITPGDTSIERAFLKSEVYNMAYSIKQNGTYFEIGNYETRITVEENQFNVKTTLEFYNSDILWQDHFVSDANSLKPISSISDRKGDRIISIRFADKITGIFRNDKNGLETPILVENTDNFFDISTYPYLLKSLPLKSGYQARIPVFDFEAVDANKKFSEVILREVKSDLFVSDLTGEHQVWKLDVFEESTKHNFQYFIDKSNRRIWQINIFSVKGDMISLKNKETDFNPFTNQFNKKETLKLVNEGHAIIEGVAFARDNENEGALKGLAVLNINKKQYAPKGTTVVLMPYTAYYKEWMGLNQKQEKIKNATPIPLQKEAFDCLKFSTVYDDDGHFEFTNLLPGDYLISTSFGYNHTSKRTEVTGTSDVYYKGNYVGSNVYTSVFSYSTAGQANIQKVLSIKKEDEKVSLKLKKTH